MDIKSLELRPEQLRREGDAGSFAFVSTAELPALEQIIGQQRAVRSIDFGVDITSEGYNIFAVGPAGSGRTTTVRRFLTKRSEERLAPLEWCYVYNFEDQRRPSALSLPAGRASQLRHQMEDLVQQFRDEIPRAFEGEPYEQRRRELVREMQAKQQSLYQALEEYLNERGFALLRAQTGLTIAPMMDGQVLSSEAYQQLGAETRKKFEAYRPDLQEQFEKTMREARDLDRDGKKAIDEINKELAQFVVDHVMAETRESFSDCPKVTDYLVAVANDVVENVMRFMPGAGEASPQTPFMPTGGGQRWFDRYQVDVISEAGECECAPVVIEDNPTYQHLVGRMEHRAEFGAIVTDFTQIRAGSLHRANGGYLVVEAKALLTNAVAWDGLKRALKNREIKIEEVSQFYGMVATATLQPEPIPLDVKVVIIGDERLYQALSAYDEDFSELFKVKAQFVTRTARTEGTAQNIAQFVGDVCRRENLRHFAPSGVARIVQESARLADDQEKVTTRFSAIVDLIREASFWAGRTDHDLVTAEDVKAAVAERVYRLNYAAERYVETIQDGVILIDTEGAVVGQINGLSVVQAGGFAFGLASRITAKTFLGRAGVVSIDREVKMSGPIHDKGQLILASHLSSRFAQNRSMSMSASITFEQLYSGVEGDSASSTELYALLSALSGVPIKQNLAVTGSVNQSGQVQAIGGVNHKIEGFFDLCKARGLTGDQGVLIPISNVRHLMLRDDVIEAVREDRFHIYRVSTIEEGIELLTGVPAGESDEEGNYPEDTIYALVQSRLDEYADRMKEQGDGDADDDKAVKEDTQPNLEDAQGKP